MPRRWANLPDEPGVYLLYSGDELVYIGCSTNMRQRISCHNLRGKFDRAECLPLDVQKIKAAEEELIHIYWPRYNNFKGWWWVANEQRWFPIRRSQSRELFRSLGCCTAIRKAS